MLDRPGVRRPHLVALTTALTRLAVPLTAVTLAACDPCAGVASCVQDPRLGVGGQIVDRGDPSDAGRAALSGADIPNLRLVAGVRVEVTGVSGAVTPGARAAATTDSKGAWQVSLPAPDEGAATADVAVTPPGGGGYTVRGVPLRASRTRGDGNVLGRWTHQLYLTVLGEVINAPGNERPEGTRVTAVRRGGVEVAPTRNTQNPMLTVGGGRFLYDVRPLADGPVVLDFVIERAGLPTATVRGVTLAPQYEWLPPNVSGAVIFRLDPDGRRVGF